MEYSALRFLPWMRMWRAVLPLRSVLTSSADELCLTVASSVHCVPSEEPSMVYVVAYCLAQVTVTLSSVTSAPRSSATQTSSSFSADQRLALSARWFLPSSRKARSLPLLPSMTRSGPHLPATSCPETETVACGARFVSGSSAQARAGKKALTDAVIAQVARAAPINRAGVLLFMHPPC